MVSTTSLPTDRASVLRQLIQSFVDGDAATTRDLVTDDVVGWSPALFVTSRQQLLDAFEDRVGAFTDVEVQVDGLDVVRDKAIAEWRISADFTGELQVADITLQPTGDRVYLAGATFSEFEGGLIRSFRHYFDDAALLEQLLQLD